MTNYRLASKEDMLKVYDRFDLTERIGWPVIVAERKGKIVGFLGTQDRDDAVVAGPLEIKLKVKAFVLFKLIETYDLFMKAIGIKEYLFDVDKSESGWISQINDSGFCVPMSEMDNHVWYKRIV